MSDHPTLRRQDRLTVASGEEHEVRAFIDAMRREFPATDRNRIEAAYQRARQELGASESREKLQERVRAQLRH